VQTDSTFVHRLAAELDGRLRGTRLRDAGLIEDGRAALAFTGRGDVLILDPFGSPPVVFLDTVEISIQGDPGYLRAIATTLRGMRVAGVGAWPGERILTIAFAARSRFGVVDEYRLILELVPKFGNVILLKDQTIVAAAKQFGPAENQRRSILVGGAYAPPPPRPARARPTGVSASLQPPGEASVLDSLRALDAQRRARDDQSALVRKRAALRKRLERRVAALRAERARLLAARDDAAGRDRLRAQGEALYAFSHLVPTGATRFSPPIDPRFEIALDPALDAKANAAAIFARYRKLVDGLPHVERRLSHVAAELAALEEFEWQLDGADAAVIGEISSAFGAARGAPPARAREQRRKRTPPRFDLPSGARIYVGRSPEENAHVTFRVARPSDLWFHAREQPGAHVVLQAPPGREPSDADLRAAAAAAAFHSKARGAENVAIDYVARKHVRKQRDAPAGRVWYTNARTLFVTPRDPSSYVASAPS